MLSLDVNARELLTFQKRNLKVIDSQEIREKNKEKLNTSEFGMVLYCLSCFGFYLNAKSPDMLTNLTKPDK